MGQYGHFTLVWVSRYETKVFRGLTGCQRDTPSFGGVTIVATVAPIASMKACRSKARGGGLLPHPLPRLAIYT